MIRVTCAIIRNEENEILIVQRGEKSDHPFKWEFPGGKIHPGETEEECIIREIKEELAIDIVICKRMAGTAYDYGSKLIHLIPFICDTLAELPFLTEHIAFKWLDQAELGKVDFSEADAIVADEYMRNYSLEQIRNDNKPESVHLNYKEEDLRSMVGKLIGVKEAEWIAASAVENIEILQKLFDYSFSDDRKLAFHASWALSKFYDKFPEMIAPGLQRLTEALDSLDNESVQRSFLRIISMANLNDVSEKHHGILADHCFKMLRTGESAIAIKGYSMDIIYKLALIYPELINELSATIKMLEGERSAGIQARGNIILKKLATGSKGFESRRK